MTNVDPFSSRFEVFGRGSRHLVMEVNGVAFEKLLRLLQGRGQEDGRVILLKAPRAGYGKTFLLQRLAEAMGHEPQFVKVTLRGGRTIDASHVLDFVLQSLCRVLPASGGLTDMDLLARRILARGLEPLVGSGEVPCQDRDGALAALRQQPIETFDFHHERAVTAHWTETNFEILGPRLAAELSGVSGASLRESAYWVELMFRFATTSPENVERSRLLFETVFRSDVRLPSESSAGERLHGLLALLGIVTQVMMVIDDTEGLSTHPPDALELASFVTNMVHSCPGMVVILSVNNDVWDTAFAPRLPGGLADRLTEYEVTLGPLSRGQAEDLIRVRAGGRADEVLAELDLESEQLFARDVLRKASAVWADLDHEVEADLMDGLPRDGLGPVMAGLGALTGTGGGAVVSERTGGEGDFAAIEPEKILDPESAEDVGPLTGAEEDVESGSPDPAVILPISEDGRDEEDEDPQGRQLHADKDGAGTVNEPGTDAQTHSEEGSVFVESGLGETAPSSLNPFAAVPPVEESSIAALASREDMEEVKDLGAGEVSPPNPFAAVPPPLEPLFAADEKVEDTWAEDPVVEGASPPNPFEAVPAKESPIDAVAPQEDAKESVSGDAPTPSNPFAAVPPPMVPLLAADEKGTDENQSEESVIEKAPVLDPLEAVSPEEESNEFEELVAEEAPAPNPFEAVSPAGESPFAAVAPREDVEEIKEPAAGDAPASDPFAAGPPPFDPPFAADEKVEDVSKLAEPVVDEKVEDVSKFAEPVVGEAPAPSPFEPVSPVGESPFAAVAPEEDVEEAKEPAAGEATVSSPFTAGPPPLDPLFAADEEVEEVEEENRPAAGEATVSNPFAAGPPPLEPLFAADENVKEVIKSTEPVAGETPGPNPFVAVPPPLDPSFAADENVEEVSKPAEPVVGETLVPNPFAKRDRSELSPFGEKEDKVLQKILPENHDELPNPFAVTPTQELASPFASDVEVPQEDVPPVDVPLGSDKPLLLNPFGSASPPTASPFAAAPPEPEMEPPRQDDPTDGNSESRPNPFAAEPAQSASQSAAEPVERNATDQAEDEPPPVERLARPNPFAAVSQSVKSPFSAASEEMTADEKPDAEPPPPEHHPRPNPFAAVPPPVRSPFAPSTEQPRVTSHSEETAPASPANEPVSAEADFDPAPPTEAQPEAAARPSPFGDADGQSPLEVPLGASEQQKVVLPPKRITRAETAPVNSPFEKATVPVYVSATPADSEDKPPSDVPPPSSEHTTPVYVKAPPSTPQPDLSADRPPLMPSSEHTVPVYVTAPPSVPPSVPPTDPGAISPDPSAASSPFVAVPPSPFAKPTPPIPEASSESDAEKPTEAGRTDEAKVDELLRQFKERYGRG